MLKALHSRHDDRKLGVGADYSCRLRGRALKEVEPLRLPVVLRRQDASVEEDEYDDEPVEPLRLDHAPTHLGAAAIQLLQPQSASTFKRDNSNYSGAYL